jgi:hypothetical protein
MKLTTNETAALAKLESKYQDIRDFTQLVAAGHSTGFYVHGPGGIGKSFNVIKTLEETGNGFKLLNSRLSAPGLAETMKKDPKRIFVIEDVEDAFTDKQALNLLRAAYWGQRDKAGKMIRQITYTTGNDKWNFDFQFEGAIIATGNRGLGTIPELRALASRIEEYELKIERDEVLAVAKKIALGGFKSDKGSLPPDVCLEILEFYKAHLPKDQTPDLRILERAYNRHLGLTKTGGLDRWQRLLLASINGGSKNMVETPSARLASLEDVASELRRKHGRNLKAILPLWKELTGESKSAYYNALDRLGRS